MPLRASRRDESADSQRESAKPALNAPLVPTTAARSVSDAAAVHLMTINLIQWREQLDHVSRARGSGEQ